MLVPWRIALHSRASFRVPTSMVQLINICLTCQEPIDTHCSAHNLHELLRCSKVLRRSPTDKFLQFLKLRHNSQL
jgi:hypothetical protein